MSTTKFVQKMSGLLLAGLLLPAVGLAARVDVKFDLLQTRTDVYTNVTVTTTSPESICILHSRGIGTIKVTDLPEDVLIKLEYKVAPKKEAGGDFGGQMSAQMKKSFSRLDLSSVEPLERALKETVGKGFSVNTPGRTIILVALGVLFVFHLFFSYCAKLICEKTGNKPSLLIWLPVLQLIPMLQAASMSPVWFLAFFLPVFNLVVAIVWAVKITRARAKSGFVALLLLLPGTNLLAFLYLAFSDAAPKEEEVKPKAKRESGMMTLETA